jgi:translation initiation factor eIF-2B subunit alpha
MPRRSILNPFISVRGLITSSTMAAGGVASMTFYPNLCCFGLRHHAKANNTTARRASEHLAQDASSTLPPTSGHLPIRPHHSRHSSRTSQHQPTSSFDIVASYRHNLASDPEITMPVAAIESLIDLLAAHPSSTAMETVEIIAAQSDILLRSVRNPMPLRAGTDLFSQHILRSLKGQTGMDFEATRRHLLANSKGFVERAKEARRDIAERGCRLIREGSTVLTAGGSRTVRALLERAAERQIEKTGAPRFRVVYVIDAQRDGESSAAAVATLRGRGVDVAVVDVASTSYALQVANVGMVLIGTESVVQTGGLLSRIGTLQIATLAKSMGIPLYVAAETHKIVRVYELGQKDLARSGVQQNVLDFRSDRSDEDSGSEEAEPEGDHTTGKDGGRSSDECPVDYTVSTLVQSPCSRVKLTPSRSLPSSSPP